MNAIICLCHFCEVHGPAVLFCTQAFHSDQPPSNDQDTDSLCEEGSSSQVHSRWLSSITTCSTATAESSVPITKPVHPKASEICDACRSLPVEQPGYISNDNEARVCYVSSQSPQNAEVFSIVRHACVRSLSCEGCQGEEGPMFFGDDHRSQVLSHKFFLRDTSARGSRRHFSIIVVMMDKIFLLNSWPFLVAHLRHIIGQLKSKVDVFYNGEDAAKALPPRDKSSTSTAAMGRSFQRGASKITRSLVDLTGDRRIYAKLHQAFTSILKAGGSRLTERLLEGAPTEDSVIDFDRQEETDEGFVKLFRHVGVSQSVASGSDEEDQQQQESSLAATHVFTGLRNLFKVLGYSKFHIIAHHIIIGKQLIVRASQRQLVRSVIDCLKTLLPKGCCCAVYFTKNYDNWKQCNFVGMPLHVPIPDKLDRDGVILEISEPRRDKLDPSGGQRSTSESMFEEPSVHQVTELQSRHYHISPDGTTLPSKSPTVLVKMEKALLNDNLADSVVEQCLICLKEEWMSKVKVMYKFTRIGGNRSQDDKQKLLQVVGAREEDMLILSFWERGLSAQYCSNDEGLHAAHDWSGNK